MQKFLLLLLSLASLQAFAQKNTDTRVFELRIYYAEPGKLDALIQRFQNHTQKLFKKHGMENIAYWLPVNNDKNQLIYVLAYPTMAAREASWKAFQEDPNWVKAKGDSEVTGKLVNHVESYFMNTTDFSPAMLKKLKTNRVYEMRTYTCKPGKLEDLKTRFRNHTMGIFKRLGAQNGPYWTTIEKDDTQPKLIYILVHKDVETGTTMFKTLLKDPEWIKISTESERNGKLLDKIESVYMKPMPRAKK